MERCVGEGLLIVQKASCKVTNGIVNATTGEALGNESSGSLLFKQ